MATCDFCGGEIVFRYVDGQRKPIHVSGSCSGGGGGSAGLNLVAVQNSFNEIASFVNPNALCPVCGERVYFYQSPSGGRVFFDEMGWPWEKHGCTDNPKSQQGELKAAVSNIHRTFRNRDGKTLDLYELVELKEKDNLVHLKFNRMRENRSFRVALPVDKLKKRDIRIIDLQRAPSFVVSTYEDHRVIEFISARKQEIDRFTAARPKATQ